MGQEEQQQRSELISRMFALITGKLEDAATLAAESQGRYSTKELTENAAAPRELVSEVLTVVDAIEGLVR